MKKSTIYAIIGAAIALIIIFVLLGRAEAPTIDNNTPTGEENSSSANPSTTAPFSNTTEEGYSIYVNTKYGFSIMYPTSINKINFNSAGDRDNLDSADIFTAQIPDDTFKGTNLREVTIIAGAKKTDANTCSNVLYENNVNDFGSNNASRVNINGINFTKVKVQDAGAGNIYNTTRYSTYKNNTCYELLSVAHSSNIGILRESDPNVKEYDENLFMPEFQEIVSSFKFTAI